MPPAGAELPPLVLVADDVDANAELLADQLTRAGRPHRPGARRPECARGLLRGGPRPLHPRRLHAGGRARRWTTATPASKSAAGSSAIRAPQRIPVIFVTALNDTADRVKAIEAGGDDFLLKPHNRLVLGARVRSLLKLKSATDALEQSYRTLRELTKVRDDLMKMIVHDLKTPLTSVLATLEMLREGDYGPMAEGQYKAVSEAEGKAEDLLGLIQDLLEVARVEETRIAISPEPIAPAAFLSELVIDWNARFTAEGASMAYEAADEAPVFSADKALLRRVFSNLVQNALSHSATTVHVELAARRDPQGILFTVTDNGPGIPAEFQEVIFRKFEQVRSPNAPRTRSSGLGLAFCRLAVEAHGGRIWVRSKEREGSTFYIQLPVEPKAGD